MPTTIETNDRFDKLTNLDISTHYRDNEFYLFPHSFLSAFAYWVTAQNPNEGLLDLRPALIAYEKHLLLAFDNPRMPQKFRWEEVKALVNADLFEEIPEINVLNIMTPDFIDLDALARNVFYMILREHITQ